MEKKGFVSIWFGNIKSEEELSNYVDLTYEEDDKGEFILSSFLQEFKIGIESIDEDFIEKENYNLSSDDINTLLDRVSYSDIVVPNMTKKLGNKIEEKVNTIILVYNLKYSGEVIDSIQEDYNFKYYGCVSYI